MAEKDRAKWLKLFYTRLGYEPISALRKKNGYVRETYLTEALEKASDYNIPFLIQVVFPFKYRPPFSDKMSDSIAIFPQTVYDNKNNIYELNAPILYDGIFHSLDNFISKCPPLVLYNAEDTFGAYAFSLPYFMLSPEEVKKFSKVYLTPIKGKIVKTDFYPEGRGKNKKESAIRAERNKFIINEYKKYRKGNRLPIKKIEENLIKKAQEFSDKLDIFNEYNCSRETIRRVLNKYNNK